MLRRGGLAVVACLALLAPVAPAIAATPATTPATSPSSFPSSAAPARPAVALTLRPCPTDLTGWRCSTLTVPRDWFGTSDLTARIPLAVMPARGERIGALTFNPGGPGGSGIEAASRWYAALPERMKDSFDFVAWDPRGVGGSTPKLTGCRTKSTRAYYDRPATGPVDWLAFTRDVASSTGPELQRCWEANPDVAPYLGTDYVVEDLEAMRVALGYDQWSFLGMSYGSRIGYRYARAYPASLRALVMDGAWDPNATLATWAAADSWAFTYAQSVFSSLFDDRLAARFARVLKALNARTVVIDGRTRTRWDLTPALLGDISSQSAYDDIRAMIDTTYDALFRTTSPAQERRAGLAFTRLARDAEKTDPYTLNMVMCADMSGRPTLEETARYAESAYVNSSVLASLVTVIKGTTCEGLPDAIERPYPPIEEEIALVTPPVVLNALGDTRTPWLGARTMASYFTGSSFITYNGTQHVIYRKLRSACLNVPVTTYFMTLTVPASTTCTYAPLRQP